MYDLLQLYFVLHNFILTNILVGYINFSQVKQDRWYTPTCPFLTKSECETSPIWGNVQLKHPSATKNMEDI